MPSNNPHLNGKKLADFWKSFRLHIQALWQQLPPLITYNFTLKLAALLIATVLWGFVASQRRGQTSDIVFTSSVVLKNIPEHLQVLDSNVQTASVLLNVEPNLAGSVNPALFQLVINLQDASRGSSEKHLAPSSLVYNNQSLPKEMRVLRINPNRVRILLAESIDREVEISPQLSGNPAEGFSITSIQIEPRKVSLSGPRSTLEKFHRVHTLPINVEKLSENKELNTELQLPQYVRLAKDAPETFQARILVSERPKRELVLNIPVVFENARTQLQYQHSVNKVNAYLLGPEKLLKNLTLSKIYAVLDLSSYTPGDYRGLKPQVQLPEGIRVLEQWPIVDLFVIKRP